MSRTARLRGTWSTTADETHKHQGSTPAGRLGTADQGLATPALGGYWHGWQHGTETARSVQGFSPADRPERTATTTMMNQSVRDRLSQADTWLLEFFLGLYTLLWGLSIANPLTDAFLSSPRSYALLSDFPGGESVFGLLAAVCGGLVMSAVLSGSRRTRSVSTGVAGLAWFCVAVAILVPTRMAGGGVLMLVAFAHWFCWARLSYRGRHVR